MGGSGKVRPGARVLGALGLVTASTLAFQVVLTRLLSSVLAYHFSFLAISLALLGTGAGALAIYVRPGWFDGPLEATLARWAAIYGALLIVTPPALVRLDYSMSAGVTGKFPFNLAIACVLGAAPALAAGAVVALAIRGYADDVGRVYAWDLVGAGLGALVIVPLLRFPAPVLLVALGVVACGAAALFAGPSAARMLRRRIGAIAGAGVALIAVAAVIPVLYLPMPPVQRHDLLATPGTRSAGSRRWRRHRSAWCSTIGSTPRCPTRPATTCPTGGTCCSARPASATSSPAPATRWSSAAGAGTSTTP